MKFEIKNWITGKLALTLKGDNWSVAFNAAVTAGQKFDGADFSDKDFSWMWIRGGVFVNCKFNLGTTFDGTTFYGTKFYGTKFQKSTFNGKKIVECERPIFLIHPLGSEQRTLLAINTDKGVHIQTGCFDGLLDEFKAAIKKKHGDNEHAQEYLAALVLIELHFKLWAKSK